MTSESKLELFKLDSIDQKTLFWMMDNKPESVRHWINYISRTYSRSRTFVDADKFFSEVSPELEDDSLQPSINNKSRKILLVDDDKTYNFLHTRIFEITGIADEINATLYGVQAIDLLRKSSDKSSLPDVILLDLSMPVMDGFAFLEAFKKSDIPNKENITIIIVTSSSDYRDKAKARELGIKHFLVKPVNENELCNAVMEAYPVHVQ
jgi:CheY-like chemotaxis protein